MIVKILAGLKNKLLYGVIIALGTLLLATYVDRGSAIEERDELKQSLAERMIVNERLVSENKHLLEKLKAMPKETVTVTKEVMKEVCNGKVMVEAIKALPSKKQEGGKHEETSVAGIDDNLPTELKQLLK